METRGMNTPSAQQSARRPDQLVLFLRPGMTPVPSNNSYSPPGGPADTSPPLSSGPAPPLPADAPTPSLAPTALYKRLPGRSARRPVVICLLGCLPPWIMSCRDSLSPFVDHRDTCETAKARTRSVHASGLHEGQRSGCCRRQKQGEYSGGSDLSSECSAHAGLSPESFLSFSLLPLPLG